MEIIRVTDVALKATDVKPGMLIIERLYGMLEIHSDRRPTCARRARRSSTSLGLKEEDRIKPQIVSSQVIRNISPYHTQLINRTRHGDMILPGQSLYMHRSARRPATRRSPPTRRRRPPNINILEVRAFGSFGRVYLGGEERDIDVGYRAAEQAIDGISGRAAKVSGA